MTRYKKCGPDLDFVCSMTTDEANARFQIAKRRTGVVFRAITPKNYHIRDLVIGQTIATDPNALRRFNLKLEEIYLVRK